MRQSMTIYLSFVEGVCDLEGDQFKKLMMACFNYGLKDELPTDLNGLEKAVFRAWQANIDASNTRRDNGKKGGRPRKKAAEPTPAPAAAVGTVPPDAAVVGYAVGGAVPRDATVVGDAVGGTAVNDASVVGDAVGGTVAQNATVVGCSIGGTSMSDATVAGDGVSGMDMKNAAIAGGAVGGTDVSDATVVGDAVGGTDVNDATVAGGAVGGTDVKDVAVAGDAVGGTAAQDDVVVDEVRFRQAGGAVAPVFGVGGTVGGNRILQADGVVAPALFWGATGDTRDDGSFRVTYGGEEMTLEVVDGEGSGGRDPTG